MLDYVENTITGQQNPVSKYTYVTDDLGRRTAISYTGTAIEAYETNGTNSRLQYNDRNELEEFIWYKEQTQANVRWDTPGFYFYYDHDAIGNRLTYLQDMSHYGYDANDLNQYESIDKVLSPPPNQTENFVYDDDGNMTADGTYAYTWDGENRLIGVAPASLPGNGDKRLEFKYDYMGRRVEKIYSLHNGSTWVEQTHERFVYDEWNVVMVLNGNSDPENQTLRKYTWGLDMSGLAGSGVEPGVSPVVSGIHGAGGISGLLAWEATSVQDSPSFWYFYDGNGNVSQLIKAADQSTVAKYEYDPYGNTIVDNEASLPTANPIRFSTKWFDTESALGYWGYRYYSTRLGRWMSRDPIEEIGGINLHAYTFNNPQTMVDPHGSVAFAIPIAIGGFTVAEAAAAAFGLSLTACMLKPDCRAAVYAALADAAKSITETICPPAPRSPCPPCPTTPPYQPEIDWTPGQHGCGPHQGHWHYWQWNQNPDTCQCYASNRLTGGCLDIPMGPH